MSRLFALIIVVFIGVSVAIGQTVVYGSIEAIADESTAKVNFDISGTMVQGQPLDEYIDILSLSKGPAYKNKFDLEMTDILGQFISEFNDIDGQIMLTVSDRAALHLTIAVKECSRKGNSADCDYVFWKEGIEEPLCVISMKTHEGRFGSFTNLLGDVFREAGEDLGKYLKKRLKTILKTKNKNNTHNI